MCGESARNDAPHRPACGLIAGQTVFAEPASMIARDIGDDGRPFGSLRTSAFHFAKRILLDDHVAPEFKQIAARGRYRLSRRIARHEIPLKCPDVSRDNDLEIFKFSTGKALEKYPGALPDFLPSDERRSKTVRANGCVIDPVVREKTRNKVRIATIPCRSELRRAL
jgi:hypothetical protein